MCHQGEEEGREEPGALGSGALVCPDLPDPPCGQGQVPPLPLCTREWKEATSEASQPSGQN